ncbi:MAG: hypothetical protein ACE5GL_00155 [Calditrichia bacterium]
MIRVISIVLIIFSGLPSLLYSQACCSGGVPFLGALEVSTTPANNFQLSLTYDYNRLSRVYTGSNFLEVDPNQRQRIGQSVLLEASYGFSSRFSATVVTSVIQQKRRIASDITGETDFIRANGLGDAAVLAKFSIIPFNLLSRREAAIGAGVKIPFGENNFNVNGIRVSDDLQPGSGSWDGILWGYLARGFYPKIPVTAFLRSSYRLTGTNSFNYKFGNEFLLSLGGILSTKSFLSYSMLFRYRSVTADQRNDATLPNSGGKWLYVIPGLNVNLSSSMGVRLSGQVPVYRNLDGTQLTTTYRLSVALFYSFF